MARKTTPAPLAHYATKPVTPVINAFADWIEKEVGVTLSEQDRKVLLLGSSLRGQFQKSDGNQQRIAKAAEAKAARLAARTAKSTAAAPKTRAKAAK